MANDRPPVPAEPQAINRSWRIWATAGVVIIVVLAAVAGFILLPTSYDDGLDHALGRGAEPDTEWTATVADAVPPTEVAWTGATMSLLADADVENGELLSGQCASCHGAEGIAPNPAFPNLAGQPATAIYKQLRDFADGYRASPIMVGFAQGLSDQQMADLARFYASRDASPFTADAAVDPDVVRLVTHGDVGRGLPACNSCHLPPGGPTGSPRLEGQPATYVATQLRAFASGDRGNDIYGLMRTVAALLTVEEVDQLAAYYAP